jgi:transposase
MPRKRRNVVGFLHTNNELAASSIEGSVTSDVVIQCIDDFCRHIQDPTVLVMDNASIHTSKAFQEKIPAWEAQGVDIFSLPKYAPAFNLIEILWRLMKYAWIEFWAYTSWEHLVAHVEGVIRGSEKNIKLILSRLCRAKLGSVS